ncbi:MAG: MerR family transcriptional regulator [Cryomorphaceae bacterium]|jgi:DNA-binding transcriptional MerR regulator|nr:MerR family transcriptional regulator [Cryomorphaceae bacterium]
MIPTEFTKRYYSIGEAAALFELKTSTLRFWEKEFPELQPKKAESGARKYTAKDMEKLRQIYFLVKERGFTLEGARLKLRHAPEDHFNPEDVVRRLQKVKAEIDQFAKIIKTLP